MDALDLRLPQPGDVIVLMPEASPHRWGYRYEPPPTGEDGNVLFGTTICCERRIVAPAALIADAHTAAAQGRIPPILTCCEAACTPKPVKLPPYSGEHATCRKCGSKAVETRYTTRAADAARRYGLPRPGYPAEWLHRRCVVCGAEWDEACVTAAPAAPEDPAERHERDHHGEPNIVQLGCPLCATELATRFDLPEQLVVRAMARVRSEGNADG
jgi:hypothetical protein